MYLTPIENGTPEPHPKRQILIMTIKGNYQVSRFSTRNNVSGFDELSTPWFWQSGAKPYNRSSIKSWTYIGEDCIKMRIGEFTPMDIINSVSICLNVPVEEIKSKSRVTHIKEARMITAFFFKNYLKKLYGQKVSLERIGMYLNRDHASIGRYITIVGDFIETEKEFRDKVNGIVLKKY